MSEENLCKKTFKALFGWRAFLARFVTIVCTISTVHAITVVAIIFLCRDTLFKAIVMNSDCKYKYYVTRKSIRLACYLMWKILKVYFQIILEHNLDTLQDIIIEIIFVWHGFESPPDQNGCILCQNSTVPCIFFNYFY